MDNRSILECMADLKKNLDAFNEERQNTYADIGEAVLTTIMPLPNTAWDTFKAFNAGREARWAVGEIEPANVD